MYENFPGSRLKFFGKQKIEKKKFPGKFLGLQCREETLFLIQSVNWFPKVSSVLSRITKVMEAEQKTTIYGKQMIYDKLNYS